MKDVGALGQGRFFLAPKVAMGYYLRVAKQLSFKKIFRTEFSFGGSLLKRSHAKIARPLDSKLPIHLCLRSHISVFRTPDNFGKVNELFKRTCAKHGVKIYSYANVGNHIHAVIKIMSRWRWAAFIRELTGRLAQAFGREGVKFWSQRPFTRVVRGWKKAFRIALDYVGLNRLEADGHINRKETRTLADLRAIFDG